MADNNFEDVPDSTDWLSTPLPGLSAVEAALRCQVCKDFFRTPMLTSCAHTFCSLCIRRALSNDGKCPLCRASDQELKLRSNWSMEEVVGSFVNARTDALKFARTAGQQQTASAHSPKRKLADEGFATSDHQPETKRLRTSARLSKTRAGQATAAMTREYTDDIPQARDEEEEDDEIEDATFTQEDGLVPCPVCQSRMKQWQVFRHLDTCPGPQPQTQSAAARTSSSRTPTPNTPLGTRTSRPTPPPERLPAINYSMLKDAALRKKMSDLGLSTAGSRQHLEKRHKEWVTLWNANCDSARPKRRAELLHDLDVWERTQGAKAPVFARPGTAVRDKEFDGVAWAAKHNTSFKDLIANARKSRTQAKKQTEEAAPDKPGAGTPAGDSSEAAGLATIDLTAPPEDEATHVPKPGNSRFKDGIAEKDPGFARPRLAETEDSTVISQAPPPPPPPAAAAAYCLQDGFSEPQIPPVGCGAGSNQEAR